MVKPLGPEPVAVRPSDVAVCLLVASSAAELQGASFHLHSCFGRVLGLISSNNHPAASLANFLASSQAVVIKASAFGCE
jgi:hypothetical protein